MAECSKAESLNPREWLKSSKYFNSRILPLPKIKTSHRRLFYVENMGFLLTWNPWALAMDISYKKMDLWKISLKPNTQTTALLTHPHIYAVIFKNKTNTPPNRPILLSLSPTTFGLPKWFMFENNLIHIWNEDMNRFLSLFRMVSPLHCVCVSVYSI